MAKRIIVCILSLLILITFFFFIRFLHCHAWLSNVTITKEIDPLDVFTLIISSAITIFLAWYITKKLSEQRYEKEFIITDLKTIEDQINYIERLVQDSQIIQLQQLLDIFNKLRSNIDRFLKTIEIFEISCSESTKLNTLYNTLYKTVTDIDGIQLEMNEINRSKIHITCSNLVITTRKIIYTINKK